MAAGGDGVVPVVVVVGTRAGASNLGNVDDEKGSSKDDCMCGREGGKVVAGPLLSTGGEALWLLHSVTGTAEGVVVPLAIPLTGLLPLVGGVVTGVEEPMALRAFRRVRWYLDRATESCSFVSISVSMVFSPGGGFSTAI